MAPAPIPQRRAPNLSGRLCAVGLVAGTGRKDDAGRVVCVVCVGGGWVVGERFFGVNDFNGLAWHIR